MTWEQKYEVAGHITLSQKAEKEECWPALGSLPPFYLVRIPMGWRHLNQSGSSYPNYPKLEILSLTPPVLFRRDSQFNEDEEILLPWNGFILKQEDKNELIFFCPVSYWFL